MYIQQKRSKKPLVITIIVILVLAVAGYFAYTQFINPAQKAATKANTVAETNPFYVMVVGCDSRTGTIEEGTAGYTGDVNGKGRSDTEMLVRVDPTTYTISLVTVPRDTAITLNGQTVKLNDSFFQGGVTELEKQTESLTGVDIKYYMVVNFQEFEDLYGTLDVTANVPIAMHLQDILSGNMVYLNQGKQELEYGSEALVLARVRKMYANDLDACRQIQDRQLVQLGIEKVASSSDPSLYISLLQSLVTTNWSSDSMTATIQNFADNSSSITFQSGTGPYAGDIDDSAGGLWLIPRDTATWSKVMKVVEKGGDPTTVIALPSVSAA